MWTEGQTNTTKLIVAFRSFSKAPKNRLLHPSSPTYVYTAAIPEAITLYVPYIWASFAYGFLYLVFVFVIMCGDSKVRYNLECLLTAVVKLYLCISLYTPDGVYWKLQRVQVAGLSITKIKVVFGRYSSLVFVLIFFFTIFLPSFIQQIDLVFFVNL
jgi:hypothetical protein